MHNKLTRNNPNCPVDVLSFPQLSYAYFVWQLETLKYQARFFFFKLCKFYCLDWECWPALLWQVLHIWGLLSGVITREACSHMWFAPAVRPFGKEVTRGDQFSGLYATCNRCLTEWTSAHIWLASSLHHKIVYFIFLGTWLLQTFATVVARLGQSLATEAVLVRLTWSHNRCWSKVWTSL